MFSGSTSLLLSVPEFVFDVIPILSFPTFFTHRCLRRKSHLLTKFRGQMSNTVSRPLETEMRKTRMTEAVVVAASAL